MDSPKRLPVYPRDSLLRYLSMVVAVLSLSWLMPVTASPELADVPPYPNRPASLETEQETATPFEDVRQGRMPFPTATPLNVVDEPTKRMALTFDDGPSQFTAGILDAFAHYGGQGTFYVVGQRVHRYAHLLNRMIEQGHEIGNHTWAHERLPLHTPERVHSTISRTSHIIYETTGVVAATFRPPYMAFGERTQGLIADLGYPIVLWSVDTRDWYYRDADLIYDHIMTHASHGAIVLLHDIHQTSYEATRRAIPSLMAQGFELVTVSELLGELVAGSVHYNLFQSRE